MDNVGNKGYGTTSSSPGAGPSESTGHRHETGTHESYKHQAKNDRTGQPVPSQQFAGRPCSTRLAGPSGVSGSTGPGSVIRGISGSRLASKTSAYSISQQTAVTRLSSPHNRSSAADSSAKSLSDIARVICKIFNKGIHPKLQFMSNVTEQEVHNAVSTQQNSVAVMECLKNLKPDTTLTFPYKLALEEVAKAHILSNYDMMPNSETGSRAKESESTVEGNRQKYSPKYDLRAQTAANRPLQPVATHAPQLPKVKIKCPVLTRSRQSPGMGTQGEIQDSRADRLKPQAQQREHIQPTINKLDRPLTTVADQSDGAFLGLRDEDLTESLCFDIKNGLAAANWIKHARQSEELRPKVSSQRAAVKNVTPPVIQTDLPGAHTSTPLTSNASGSSTFRLRPSAEKKQEIPLIPPSSHFRPIRPEAKVAATSALTEGMNLPKAPEPSGARRKHPMPGAGSRSPAPVTSARSDAALTNVPHRPAQRVTQSSPEADSKHLGHATEDQVVRIARNLGTYVLDVETRKKIIDIINSLDLDEHTIEKAAGRPWEQGTPEALLLLQTEYARRETSPPAGPSVEAGHGSALAAASSNADSPENSISDSGASKQVIEAVGGRHTIDPDSRLSEEDEGGYDIIEAISEAMNEEVGVLSSPHSSGTSSPRSSSSPRNSWQLVDTKQDEHGRTEYLIRAESQATHCPGHQQRQEAELWVALGIKDPTPSLLYDFRNQKVVSSALPDQSRPVRITEEQKQTIIKKFENVCPELMNASTRQMIRRNIGTIQLTAGQVDAALHEGRESLGNILVMCKQQDSLRPDQAASPKRKYEGFVQNQRSPVSVSRNRFGHSRHTNDVTDGFVARPGQPGILPDIGAAAVHARRSITNPGEATVRAAGIQARNNNCGLASFFMCLSHDGVLDTLISDANNRIKTLDNSGNFDKARSLERLVNLLKKFNTGGDIDKYISNDELDNIRLQFSLIAATLNSDAVDTAFNNNKGQRVNFVVESAFDNSAELTNTDNKKATISLAISAVPKQGSLYATVVSLPDPSRGYMLLRGTPLVEGQQLTKANLKDLKFVPFGEQLEHNELINKMLSEIYGYLNTEAEPLQSISQLQRVPMSLKQKVTLIEMHHDRKELERTAKKSKNFDVTVKDEEVPGNLKLKKSETKPHEYNRNVTGETIKYYHNENDILSLKLTFEHHHVDNGVKRKIFEYFDEDGNLSEKIIIGMDKHCLSDTPFVRSRESDKVENGERIKVEEVLTGYSRNTPFAGNLITTKIKRADNFQDLIDIFIDGLKDKYSNGALKALLPEGKDDCPEVIFMIIPNEGKHKRCKLDWQKDVSLPTLQGDKKITYGADAMVTIAESHFLAWLRDRKNGLLHYTDSMGDSEKDVTIPMVVTMPDQNTEAALQLADQKVNGIHRHFREAERKLKVLDSQIALVMLKRKD
ncbi:hypothetical protein [Salinisphaera sp. G21_0]|uniref:hypothetical protein n=1 Tax=Salinisphaera sp. G21_0 TaxID=2821094 RepID=UPI001ADAD0F3|nr:hypothetical protein [Salinisphaera sp. G21_0]MBO9480652.1 hypothetical protein [Salinisphaera sp. G21_0]